MAGIQTIRRACMLKLNKAITGACLVIGSSLAAAAADPADVALVIKSVQQAYPKLGALCPGGPAVVRNAVSEAVSGLGASLKNDKKAAAEAAVQRILAGCPY